MYIHQLAKWPDFQWDKEKLSLLLSKVRYRQGKLIGRMESMGFALQAEATLETLTLDVLKSSEIEGEVLNPGQVRSSIARRLGMDIAGLIPADSHVEGVVEMMLDATQHYDKPLSDDRLFDWHAALFPTERSGIFKIVVGAWRTNDKKDPMQVVSGPIGRETVHFQAPDAGLLNSEMQKFLNWFNADIELDPILKAAIAHLWFVTIHPFADGNGRIARAITDMQLARADQSPQRFYSMSAQVRNERNTYYEMLENTQKGNLDITEWLTWFVNCLDRTLEKTDETLAKVMSKAKTWENLKAHSLNERQQKMLNALIDGFEGKLTSTKWAKMTKTSQDTASRDIQDLIGKGILVREAAGGRSSSYVLNVENA
jgi:Fic family protein